MKNQAKLYLAILTLALLSINIFSAKLTNKAKMTTSSKSKSLMKLKTQAKTQVKHLGNDYGYHQPVPCPDFDKEDVLAINDPPSVPNPQNTSGCRDANQKVGHDWTNIPASCALKFNDLGVNSEGGIVAIGVNGLLYFYNFDFDDFEQIQGNFHLYGLRRVDFGYDGLIYVVNYSGDTYYLSCNRYWVKLPGCAIDIGTGRGDEVAKIGCNDYCETPESAECPTGLTDTIDSSSPNVYKLHCDCDCRCCRRRCNIFVKHVFTCDKDIDRKCYWIKYPYGPTWTDSTPETHLCHFTRVDMNSSGHPIVAAICGDSGTADRHRIYQFVGGHVNVWKEIFKGADAAKSVKDICGDNLGNVFYIHDDKVYIYNSDNGDVDITAGLTTTPTPGENISCGPYAQPTITDNLCCMYTTTKLGYN